MGKGKGKGVGSNLPSGCPEDESLNFVCSFLTLIKHSQRTTRFNGIKSNAF